MSRRKQSHPRAWKESPDSVKLTTDNGEESCHPESPGGVCNNSYVAAGEAGKRETVETDPPSTGPIPDVILKSRVGDTLGPLSASICPSEELLIEGEEGFPQSYKMVIDAAECGVTGTLGFTSVSGDGEPHLEIRKAGDQVYLKLLKMVQAGTKVHGRIVDQTQDTHVKVKREPDENDAGLCCPSDACRGPSAEANLVVTGGTDIGGKIDNERGSPTARSSPNTKGSPPTREGPSSPKTHSEMLSVDEEIASDAQKCPNCSVCFRNGSNLEAHLQYYCTGRDRMIPAPSSLEPPISSVSAFKPTTPDTSLQSSGVGEAQTSSPVHICQLCQSSFMSRQNCESHMLILHCSEHVPMCRFCNFVAKSWDVLREHVFTHVKVERQPLEQNRKCSRLLGSVSDERAVDTGGNPETKDGPPTIGSRPILGNDETERERISPSADHRLASMSHSNGKTKRKIERSNEAGVKRMRWYDSLPSTSGTEVHGDASTPGKAAIGSEDCYSTTPYLCRSCSICFRSRENYVAHKQYYCKQRLSEGGQGPNSREGSPDQSSHPRRKAPRRSPMPEDVVDAPRSRPEFDRVPKLHSAHMMYMSPVVPSAMLVGGTQLISPSGAHVISPIFLVTPPVAIPMAGVEPPHSAASTVRKSKSEGDSPLDLSHRVSPDGQRTTPAIKTEPLDRKSPEESHTSSENLHERGASPPKSFICDRCGTRFWKARTLLAHKQLYCSELVRSRGLLPNVREDEDSEHGANHSRSDDLPMRIISNGMESRGGSSTEGCPKRSLMETMQAPRIRVRHSDYPMNGARCNINDYLEKIYARNCPEKQLLEGLRICTGCGVAFRKLESLEIHQKFYCQTSGSMLSAERVGCLQQGQSTSRCHPSPDRQMAGDHIQRDRGTANPPKTNEQGENEQHTSGPEHSLESRGECPSPEMDDRISKPGQTPRADASSNEQLPSRTRQEGSSDETPERVVHEAAKRFSPLRNHVQRSMHSPASGTHAEKATRNSSPATAGPIRDAAVKVEGETTSCSHRAADRVTTAKERVILGSPQPGVQIKIEPASPTASESSHQDPGRKSQAYTNGRAVSPVRGGSPLVAPRKQVTTSSSVFPPGSKACKSCNISFRSLSTFIAHKKYYCAGTASLRSNVAS